MKSNFAGIALSSRGRLLCAAQLFNLEHLNLQLTCGQGWTFALFAFKGFEISWL
jgi:hypothetical protein